MPGVLALDCRCDGDAGYWDTTGSAVVGGPGEAPTTIGGP